jgi:cell division protein FtsB
MSGLLNMARGPRGLTLPVICFALLGYLGYHAFVGERGLVTHWQLKEETARLERELAEAKARRAHIEHRVGLLGERLDPDLLDERVREVLNFARPEELTIMGPR